MNWPVTHESDTWVTRRWAIFMPPHKNGVIEARPFKTEAERDSWVAQNPGMRQAVGKRHPAVKALRQRWAREKKKAPDACPRTCTHKTFHYCGEAGTHCDKHCTCPCRMCAEERGEVSSAPSTPFFIVLGSEDP